MDIIWKYLDVGKGIRKHAFFNINSARALCGKYTSWNSPITWETDAEGLAAREACHNCARLLRLEKENNG